MTFNPLESAEQYRFSSNKGVISLIYPVTWTQNMYEIYSVGKNELFEDIERYETYQEVLLRIYELLGTNVRCEAVQWVS